MRTTLIAVLAGLAMIGAMSPIGAAENVSTVARRSGDIIPTSVGDIQLTVRSARTEAGHGSYGVRRWLGYRLLSKEGKIVSVREEIRVIGIDSRLAQPEPFSMEVKPTSKKEFSDELYFGDRSPLPDGAWFEIEQKLFLNGETTPSVVNRVAYTTTSVEIFPVSPSPALRASR